MLRAAVALLALPALLAACGTVVVDEDEGGGGGPGTGGASASGGSTGSTGASGPGGGASTAITSAASGPVDPPAPTALFVSDREGCALEAPVDEAEASLAPAAGSGVEEHLLVVELVFADECTGAGGQHVLARAVDGGALMWLGAHACYFFEPSLVDGQVHAGVARVFEDEPTETLDDAVCLAFPGDDRPLESDLGVIAIAVFPSLEAAASFVEAVGD